MQSSAEINYKCEHAGTLDVPQERMSKASIIRCPSYEPRYVSDDHPSLIREHHSQLRLERGECKAGNLQEAHRVKAGTTTHSLTLFSPHTTHDPT